MKNATESDGCMLMSFENGYNAKDYIAGCMDRFSEDKTIFVKALQIIAFFSNLPQWPHNYSNMKRAVSLIIGSDFGEFIRFMGQYLAYKGSSTVPQIDWSYTTKQFVNEAESFFVTVDDFLFRCVQARVDAFRIYEVLCSKKATDNGTKNIFKFIRADGASLEMEMSADDIKKLIFMLEDLPLKVQIENYPC